MHEKKLMTKYTYIANVTRTQEDIAGQLTLEWINKQPNYLTV
jgi:hypothetical protein